MKARVSWVRLVGCVAIVLSAALIITQRNEKTKASGSSERTSSAASKTSPMSSRQVSSNWKEAYGKLPLGFEENQGQAEPSAQFLSHGMGYQVILTSQGASISLQPRPRVDLTPRNRTAFLRSFVLARRAAKTSVVRLRLEDANPAPQIVGLDRLPGRADYFIGNDSKNWKTGIRTYSHVKYQTIYPGVDLLFYGNQRRLEYDFVVAPEADPQMIHLRIEGAQTVRQGPKGGLQLGVAGGEIEFERPVVYQDINNTRREIAGRYVILGPARVGFAVSEYDHSQPLVVDPVLDYSTYLGGTGDENVETAIAVDSNGHAFVAGTTFSTDFPTTASAFKGAPPTTTPAVFVSEFDPTGTSLLYSTYLGGSGGDFGLSEGLDSSGNVYVTGQSLSTDFPTTSNGMIQSPLASNPKGTAFLAKINPSASGASSLVYSSYFGGTNGDFANSIVADSNQVAYLAGFTISGPGALGSGGFTTANAFQATLSSAAFGNAFVAAIDTTKMGAAGLKYSTYLGGNGANAATANQGFADSALGIATDGAGGAFVAGTTTSNNFPTTAGAFQTALPTGNTLGAAFVAKFDTTASGNASLAYSTYLGGKTADFGTAIALGPNHVAYAVGTTSSANFPTTSGNISAFAAAGPAFLSLVDTSKSGNASLPFSTWLGGTNGEIANGVQADTTNGFAFLGGNTGSANFPVTTGAFQPALAPGAKGDGFIAKINPNPAGTAMTNLLYSTYFGGSGAAGPPDGVNTVAIDSSDDIYLGGITSSANLPLAPAPPFQSTLKGSSDAFVAKMGTLDFKLTATAPAPDPVIPGAKAAFTVTMTPVGGFTGTVSLACTGAPANSTCTLTSNSLTAMDGLTPQNTNGEFQTTAMIIPMGKEPNPPVTLPVVVLLLLSAAMYLMPRVQRQIRIRLALAGIILAFAAFAGCGSSNHPTPAGPYNLTITGTSTTPSLTHTVQVMGTVQ